jgi:hypothetical protein
MTSWRGAPDEAAVGFVLARLLSDAPGSMEHASI